jgi:hypothetical protein
MLLQEPNPPKDFPFGFKFQQPPEIRIQNFFPQRGHVGKETSVTLTLLNFPGVSESGKSDIVIKFGDKPAITESFSRVDTNLAQMAIGLKSTLCAMISARSRVLHGDGCWAEAKWDVYPSGSVTQVWKVCIKKRLKPEPNCIAAACRSTVQQSLGHWEQNRYDFHWREDPIPRALVLHREHQQDALRFSWPGDGLVAGTDDGV